MKQGSFRSTKTSTDPKTPTGRSRCKRKLAELISLKLPPQQLFILDQEGVNSSRNHLSRQRTATSLVNKSLDNSSLPKRRAIILTPSRGPRSLSSSKSNRQSGDSLMSRTEQKSNSQYRRQDLIPHVQKHAEYLKKTQKPRQAYSKGARETMLSTCHK